MKTKIEIKSILGNVLFTYEAENATIKDAIQNAVLRKTDLRYAEFSGAYLRGAYFRYAYLRGAYFRGADLRYANLRGVYLRGADFRGADLSGADLRGADLRYAYFSGADLRGADLSGADLSGADFSGAYLRGADLSGAKNIENANMPLFCKWNYSILGDKIEIGCEKRTIKEWDIFFASDEVLSTKIGTEEFKQIEAIYLACKAYLTHLTP